MHRERVGFGEGFVFLVKSRGVGGGNGVVGFFAGTEVVGVFADDRCVGALLSGGVFDFDDAGEVFVVGIIHLHGRLEEAGRSGLLS